MQLVYFHIDGPHIAPPSPARRVPIGKEVHTSLATKVSSSREFDGTTPVAGRPCQRRFWIGFHPIASAVVILTLPRARLETGPAGWRRAVSRRLRSGGNRPIGSRTLRRLKTSYRRRTRRGSSSRSVVMSAWQGSKRSPCPTSLGGRSKHMSMRRASAPELVWARDADAPGWRTRSPSSTPRPPSAHRRPARLLMHLVVDAADGGVRTSRSSSVLPDGVCPLAFGVDRASVYALHRVGGGPAWAGCP